jgi:hypothetical protein
MDIPSPMPKDRSSKLLTNVIGVVIHASTFIGLLGVLELLHRIVAAIGPSPITLLNKVWTYTSIAVLTMGAASTILYLLKELVDHLKEREESKDQK